MSDQPINFRLYLITDRNRTGGRPLVAALQAAAHAGVNRGKFAAVALELREKDLSPREQYGLAAEVKAALGPLGTRILINDRADIACAAGLAGVHLPSSGLSPAAARRCLPADALVAVSTHSLAEARFAEEFGADFITFGPVYPTPSKLAYGAPRGLEELRQVCATVKIPVFALGGVTPERVGECLEAGAHGVAAIGALLDVPSIPEAVAAFLDQLPA